MAETSRMEPPVLPRWPIRVHFPVVGLAASYVGPRWLASWQQYLSPQVAWQVGLGHGDENRTGPFVVVESMAKFDPNGEALNREHSSLSTLAFDVLFHLVFDATTSISRGKKLSQSLTEIRGLARLEGDDWQPSAIRIDDRVIEGLCWRRVDQVAWIGETPETFVGIYGRAVEPTHHDLATVGLASYPDTEST